MKIPLTKHGLPELIIYPGMIILAIIILPLTTYAFLPIWALCMMESLLFVVFIWMLSFFRDPERHCPQDDHLLLSPADGRITDVVTLENHEAFDGEVLKIGIFLSIFNVHINRMPCQVIVEKTTYTPGRFKNAMDPESSRVNESNAIFLKRCTAPEDTLLVRQISGAIARRIVCPISEGQRFRSGDRFGMIKFGSRTELYVPIRKNLVCCARVGDKVKAGSSILAKYTSLEIPAGKNAKDTIST
jgi:phosphatidylserine decarboxylase